MPTRRHVLAGVSAAALSSGLGWPIRRAGAQETSLALGEARPFDFDWLRDQAWQVASRPYHEPEIRHEELLHSIDYDAFQKIQFRPEFGLWVEQPGTSPIQLFHLGRFFKAPVAMHVVQGGMAREVLYNKDAFNFHDPELKAKLPDDLGFSGFRAMNTDTVGDWLAFLGASYFRSSGPLNQYGLSARAVAIDTALPSGEEFPRFTSFWLERGAPESGQITVYALLDGPSLAGAYRMVCTKGSAVVMDIDAVIYPRKDIALMGIGPMTSMFWFSETNRHRATDWRPEIHDSDGLALWRGNGERVWRPLNNPDQVRINAFIDENPKGFGLLQRDRAFYNYEDDGVFYDRRPSVWVEPLEPWGRGQVQLIEIPTDDEIHDNIVALWVPEEPVKAKSTWSYRYRLHWVEEQPYPPENLAIATSTRLGRGGIPGQPRPKGVMKFVVDFEGEVLEDVAKLDPVEPVVSASRGEISNAYALQVVGTTNWRAFFDLDVEGNEPVDLRLFLKLEDRPLTETWLYQYLPFSFEA